MEEKMFRCKDCGESETAFNLELYAIQCGCEKTGAKVCTTCEGMRFEEIEEGEEC